MATAELVQRSGMGFCRGCGTQIHETAPSCPKCGAVQRIDRDPSAQRGGIIGAYVTAVIFPLLGIGLGVYLLVKKRWLHGIFSILLGVFMLAFWGAFWPAFEHGFKDGL